MQVKVNPSKDETGSGLTAFVSWGNPSLQAALETVFAVNRHRERIDTVEISPLGITARLSHRPSPVRTVPVELRRLLRKRYQERASEIIEIIRTHKTDKNIVNALKAAGIIAKTSYWKDIQFYKPIQARIVGRT